MSIFAINEQKSKHERRNEMIRPWKESRHLWTEMIDNSTGNFLRQFRYTACPVMGDDDVDEEPDDLVEDDEELDGEVGDAENEEEPSESNER
jgi:hypothetical protein